MSGTNVWQNETGDRLLLVWADHLHQHCQCEDWNRNAGEALQICDACDLRTQLRVLREELLAWRAQGDRLIRSRSEVLSSARAAGRRRVDVCSVCAGLTGFSDGVGSKKDGDEGRD